MFGTKVIGLYPGHSFTHPIHCLFFRLDLIRGEFLGTPWWDGDGFWMWTWCISVYGWNMISLYDLIACNLVTSDPPKFSLCSDCRSHNRQHYKCIYRLNTGYKCCLDPFAVWSLIHMSIWAHMKICGHYPFLTLMPGTYVFVYYSSDRWLPMVYPTDSHIPHAHWKWPEDMAKKVNMVENFLQWGTVEPRRVIDWQHQQKQVLCEHQQCLHHMALL
jgi:hypothetical protein